MAEGPSTRRRRVFVEDARREGAYLRMTWHPDGRQFVVSTWTDDVCTGAVRVRVEEAAGLIALLADGMAEATAAAPPPTTGTPHTTGWRARVDALLRRARRAA
jgi:hypothetical protein